MPAPALPYLPRLDVFRAVAALSVVFAHYGAFAPKALVNINFAGLGVSLFFVLSGFLITTVLVEDGQGGIRERLRRFYIRRSCRIFPPYYLLLAAGVALAIPGFRASLPWSVVYLTNFGSIAGGGLFEYAGHLWTLAIEEQFYLLWPIILLIAGPRIGLFISASGCCLAIYYKQIVGGAWLNFSTLSSADFLFCGAMLAILRQFMSIERIELGLRCLLPVVLPALFMLSIDAAPTVAKTVAPIIGRFFPYWVPLGFSLSCCWLIARAVRDGPLASSWGGPFIVALGRISYGIYLYHLPIRYFLDGIDPNWHWYWRFGGAGGTILIAWISYRFFEQPLIQIGRQLAHRPSNRVRQSAAAAIQN